MQTLSRKKIITAGNSSANDFSANAINVKASTIAPLITRIFLSIVLFPHGAQKLMGWFGGFGFEGTMKYFTETVGLPWIVGFAVILIEFFGPIALILGIATRFWSLAIASVMTGIILTNFSNYFFMNWFGNQPTEGMEFFLLAIGLSVSLLLTGAGAISIDAKFSRKKSANTEAVGNNAVVIL